MWPELVGGQALPLSLPLPLPPPPWLCLFYSVATAELLTALLLPAVVAELSDHHGCLSRGEKADSKLQFVSRRPLTTEIRCSRSVFVRTSWQPLRVNFKLRCCCRLWSQSSATVTGASAVARRPTASLN